MNGADLWDRHIESYGLGVTMSKDETIRLQAEEIGRLRALVYAYPPSEEFAPDGITWKQEAELLRGQLHREARGE